MHACILNLSTGSKIEPGFLNINASQPQAVKTELSGWIAVTRQN
jgi:hypothetical protein